MASVEGQGTLVFQTTTWDADVGHVAFGNAQAGVPIGQQYVCSANASRKAVSRANEILCYRLDGSLDVLVVAPNLTSLDASGGGSDDYSEASEGQPRHHRRGRHLDRQRGDEPPRCVHRVNISEGPAHGRRPAFTVRAVDATCSHVTRCWPVRNRTNPQSGPVRTRTGRTGPSGT